DPVAARAADRRSPHLHKRRPRRTWRKQTEPASLGHPIRGFGPPTTTQITTGYVGQHRSLGGPETIVVPSAPRVRIGALQPLVDKASQSGPFGRQDPSLPQVFGRYLLIQRLSRGGMGEI